MTAEIPIFFASQIALVINWLCDFSLTPLLELAVLQPISVIKRGLLENPLLCLTRLDAYFICDK